MYTNIYDLSSINTIKNCDNDNNYKLKYKKLIKNNKTYNIYQYDKKYLTFDMTNSIGLYRSVIFYKDKILSFSPPKSLNMPWF